MTNGRERLHEPSQREARAARILDVAADLLMRHGYRRVTIDDIARGAGVGKGTVYLHWKTREQLCSAVFEREVIGAIEGLLQAMRQDPYGFLLHRLAYSYFLAIMQRPLLRGFVLADEELLGKLAQPGEAREERHRLLSHDYVALLSEHGLLHADLRPEAVEYAFLAVFEGFLRAEPSSGKRGPDELRRRADLLALTVKRAFETGRQLPAATRDLLSRHVIELLGDLVDADRADLNRAS